MNKAFTLFLTAIMMMSCRNTPEQAGGQKDKAWEEQGEYFISLDF